MIELLYTTTQGKLIQKRLIHSPELNLTMILTLLANKGICLEDHTFFRNNLPLKAKDPIQLNDRIFALKEARLPPAVWRADRVIRVNTKN